MHNQGRHSRFLHRPGERKQLRELLPVIGPDAGLDRDRPAGGVPAHCAHAVGHAPGFMHQAGAEAAGPDACTGAAHVQVDLVETGPGCMRGGNGELFGSAASELQGQRAFSGVIPEEPAVGGVDHGLRVDHFRVQAHIGRQKPVKVAAVPVGALHHGRYRHGAGGREQ